ATATLTPTTAATCARLIKTSSHQKPHPPQLVAASTHLTTRFNHVLTFTERLTLIVRLLTPPQSDLNLRAAIHKIQLQRHHCITLIVHARIQPVDLFTMQRSLRFRRAAWFVHVPSVYSGIWTFSNHASPRV